MYPLNGIHSFILLLSLLHNITPSRQTKYDQKDHKSCKVHNLTVPDLSYDWPMYVGWDLLTANSTQHLIFSRTFDNCRTHNCNYCRKAVFADLSHLQPSSRNLITSDMSVDDTRELINFLSSNIEVRRKSRMAGVLSQKFKMQKEFLANIFQGKNKLKIQDLEVKAYLAYRTKCVIRRNEFNFDKEFFVHITRAAELLQLEGAKSRRLSKELELIVGLYGTHYWHRGVFGEFEHMRMVLSPYKLDYRLSSSPEYWNTAEKGCILTGGKLKSLDRLVKKIPYRNMQTLKKLAKKLKQTITNYYEKHERKGCTLFSAVNFNASANVDDGTCIGESLYDDITFLLMLISFVALGLFA